MGGGGGGGGVEGDCIHRHDSLWDTLFSAAQSAAMLRLQKQPATCSRDCPTHCVEVGGGGRETASTDTTVFGTHFSQLHNLQQCSACRNNPPLVPETVLLIV